MTIDIHSYIETQSKRDGRQRPFIKGTRVEVAHIVAESEYQGMSAEEISSGYDHVSLAAVYAALAYYHANRDEVHQMMRQDDQIVASYRSMGNTDGKQGVSDDARSVSP